jgi:hypothetical protein
MAPYSNCTSSHPLADAPTSYYVFFNRDPAARGTIKTPGFISLLEMPTGVTDFCKFIVSIGSRATADSSIVLFSRNSLPILHHRRLFTRFTRRRHARMGECAIVTAVYILLLNLVVLSI